MSDSTAHRPISVYSLAALALLLFIAHAVNAIASKDVEVTIAKESAPAEVIIITRPSVPDLSHLREDLARLREDTENLRFHVELDREPALPGRITIRRQ